MLFLKKIIKLKSPFISAGSGLILVKNKFFIVADDEVSLLSLSIKSFKGSLHRLFPGKLPTELKARKKLKPDLESLVELPAQKEFPNGALMCVPSGSKENRTVGCLKKFNSEGVLKKVSTPIQLKKIFRKLSKEFRELNIEGSIIIGESLWLFQRGNGVHHENAVIAIKLSHFLADQPKIQSIKRYDLGTLKKIPLSFTDATIHKNDIWFLAVAENSESTYLDGEVLGSVLGRMNKKGKIIKTYPLRLKSKPEGICIDGSDFYVVTDDDDRKVASAIWRGKLPLTSHKKSN